MGTHKFFHLKTGGLLGLGLALAACSNPEALPNQALPQMSQSVIYGQDDRVDLEDVTDPRWLEIASSTVALIRTSNLKPHPDPENKILDLIGKPFGSSSNLCPTERFRDQNSAAFCSGALVAPDLILTAGHCIDVGEKCASTAFVFDFAVFPDTGLKQSFHPDEIYRCQEIVARELVGRRGSDFALVRLDRPVLNRKPLPLQRGPAVQTGDPLVVIGHPSGLPKKVAPGAVVRENLNPDYFVANLDTYGGNSGSPVFHAETGEIAGILVRGDQDYRREGSCRVSVVREDQGGRGEDVTHVSKVLDLVPEPIPVPPQAETGEAPLDPEEQAK